jgi:hypothetical protein
MSLNKNYDHQLVVSCGTDKTHSLLVRNSWTILENSSMVPVKAKDTHTVWSSSSAPNIQPVQMCLCLIFVWKDKHKNS